MKMLRDMNVGSKIIVLVTFLLACTATVSIYGMIALRQLDAQADFFYDIDLLALSAGKEANTQLLDLSLNVRNIYFATGDLRKEELEAFRTHKKLVTDEIDMVRAKLFWEHEKAAFAKVEEILGRLLPAYEDIVENMDIRAEDETLRLLTAVRPLTDAADEAMSALCLIFEQEAQKRSLAMGDLADRGFLISLLVLGVALCVGGSLGVVLRRSIANPLGIISGKAAAVAAGDLEQTFALDRKDELGVLADALETMVHNLRERIAEAEQKSREAQEQTEKAQVATEEATAAREKAEHGQRAILETAEQVEHVVNRLSTATEELSAQMEQASRSTDISRERTAASASAMEEMNATVLEVASNASTAATGSEKAKSNALEGEGIVNESVEAITRVQDDTAKLQADMEALGRQAESIGSIMTVISDIADQTNLLALNAAIEAARAGDAGRGFAVVADEVRKLAEKTMNATKEVGDTISGIQNGARQSIAAMDSASGKLQQTTLLVQRSGEALSRIVSEVSEAAVQVSSIATAAEEQSATSEEITRALEEINRMADENSTATQQSAQAISDLAAQAQELQQLVNALRNG